MSAATVFLFAVTALAEIAGCYAFWAWARLEKSALWLLPGTASLLLFAWLLTRMPSDAAGRSYAAYGGVYVVASILWLWFAEGQKPELRDLIGAGVCLLGTLIILWPMRPQ